MHTIEISLSEFVHYVQTHLTGDEKGEAADFLDHLFRALGHAGIKEAGATRETRLAKKGGAKGKNFAVLLWPDRVLFEMKSPSQFMNALAEGMKLAKVAAENFSSSSSMNRSLHEEIA